jgi:hypothetical protein
MKRHHTLWRRAGIWISAFLIAVSALSLKPPVASATGLCPVYNDGTYSFATLVAKKGVDLCVERKVGVGDIAYWTVVDFKAGARARIIGQVVANLGQRNAQFFVRTAPSWFSYVQSNIPSPSNGALFSVTNASFFTTFFTPTTSTSYPVRQDWQLSSSGNNPDSNQKRWLGFRDNTSPYALLGTYDYNGQNYTGNDPAIAGQLYTDVRDYAVALSPTTVIGGAEQRTMVCVLDTDGNANADRMIILQTNIGYTNSDANNALGWWGCPSALRIQFDGGGSRQFYADNGNFQLSGRPVPNVLAIWVAP